MGCKRVALSEPLIRSEGTRRSGRYGYRFVDCHDTHRWSCSLKVLFCAVSALGITRASAFSGTLEENLAFVDETSTRIRFHSYFRCCCSFSFFLFFIPEVNQTVVQIGFQNNALHDQKHFPRLPVNGSPITVLGRAPPPPIPFSLKLNEKLHKVTILAGVSPPSQPFCLPLAHGEGRYSSD